jgi:hypothetical protein
MVLLAKLESRHGNQTSIEFGKKSLEDLAREGRADAYIVSTEDGFSPLGANSGFLSNDLGIPYDEIKRLANWNRFENPRVSLVALRSRRSGSLLRGVILAAAGSSECYKRFGFPRRGPPYRDFYYNVTYEAIAYACGTWGAKRLAITHLSGCCNFHVDIATCNAEALAHYCDAQMSAEIESFIFDDFCEISSDHIAGIARLNAEAQTSRHHPIFTVVRNCDGYDLVHLGWGPRNLATTLRGGL